MKVFNSYVRRAEEFSHNKELGGGIPGHILGYGMAALDPFIQGAFNATDYLFPIPKGNSKSIGSETSNKIIDQVMPNQQQKKKRQQRKPKGKKPPRKQNMNTKRSRAPIRRAIASARRPKPKRGIPLARRSGGDGRRVNAPVVSGRVRQAGSYMNFFSGSKPGCIMIEGKVQIAQIVVSNAVGSDSNTYTTSFFNSVSGDICVYVVAPQNTFYSPSPIWVFSQLFERFRMKTRLHYYGSSGTGSTGIVKFAFFEDPSAFYANSGHGGGSGGDSKNWPRPQDFIGLSESMEGPVWTEFSTPWSHTPSAEDMRYIPADTYTTTLDASEATGISAASLRQTTAGMWVTTCSNVNPGTAPSSLLIGDLWMEYRLELCDIMTGPVFATIDELTGHASLRRRVVNSERNRVDALINEIKALKASLVPDDDDGDDEVIPRVFPSQVKEFKKSHRPPVCHPSRREVDPVIADRFVRDDEKLDSSLTQPSSKTKSSSLK